MIDRLKNLFNRILPRTPEQKPEPLKKKRFMDSDTVGFIPTDQRDATATQDWIAKAIPRKLNQIRTASETGDLITTDSKEVAEHGFSLDSIQKQITAMDGFTQPQVPSMVATWYSAQSFIGSQLCAILAQQWLINKACVLPAQDAVRKGWDISLTDGTKLTPEQMDYIKQRDIELGIAANLIEYVQFSRVFGIRIAIFLVDNDDKDYYAKPFNIDGCGEGKYKGITQLDPYWIAPELDMSSSANPVNKNFYQPTWWVMSGMRVHRSHIGTLIPNPVADVLKPTYFFGGVPLTQQIFERVYNAERCASEAVQLLQTKRANVMFADLEKMLANQAQAEIKLTQWAYYRDNYAVKVLGEDERYEQHDTALTDLDTTILTQFELVAAIAGIPSSKLLGHAPSGSLAQTGEGEEANYHQLLESIQANDLDPILSRHYELLCKSELEHKWSELKGKNIVVTWRELDAMTELERADVNLKKAQTDQVLRDIGAVDGTMSHERIIKDKDSGYEGYVVGDDLTDEPDDLLDAGEPPLVEPQDNDEPDISEELTP